MHLAPRRGGGGAVDPVGQQRMTESNAIAVDPDDAAILGVDSEGPAHQIRGRGAQARDRQERLTNVAREPVDPLPHQLGQGGRECTGLQVVGGAAGEFDGIERITAGHFVNPHHRRPGERAPQPMRQHRVQGTDAQGPQPNPLQRFGPAQLQPQCLVLADASPHGADHLDGPAESARGECDRVDARGVQPLRIVQRDQYRRPFGQPRDDREQGGRHGTRIGAGTVVGRAEQDAIERAALRGRQEVQGGRLDTGEQIGQRRIPQGRFGDRGTGEQHGESPFAGPVDRREQHRRLADAGFTVQQQCRGLRATENTADEFGLGRTTQHLGRHRSGLSASSQVANPTNAMTIDFINHSNATRRFSGTPEIMRCEVAWG